MGVKADTKVFLPGRDESANDKRETGNGTEGSDDDDDDRHSMLQ